MTVKGDLERTGGRRRVRGARRCARLEIRPDGGFRAQSHGLGVGIP